jgi:hypothetical protein
LAKCLVQIGSKSHPHIPYPTAHIGVSRFPLYVGLHQILSPDRVSLRAEWGTATHEVMGQNKHSGPLMSVGWFEYRYADDKTRNLKLLLSVRLVPCTNVKQLAPRFVKARGPWSVPFLADSVDIVFS